MLQVLNKKASFNIEIYVCRERRKAGDFDHLTVEEARRLPRRLIFKFGPKLLK